MMLSAVSGAKMPEYAVEWLTMRLLKAKIRSFIDTLPSSTNFARAALHHPAATSGPSTLEALNEPDSTVKPGVMNSGRTKFGTPHDVFFRLVGSPSIRSISESDSRFANECCAAQIVVPLAPK